MAAFVAHFKTEIGVGLLGQSDVIGNTLAIHTLAAAAFVQRVIGLNQFALVLQQPVDAVVRSAAFFVRSQRDNQIAIRFEAFALIPDQIRNPDGRLRFVIGGSASVEVAVLFNELERVHAPVLALRLHDIDVGQQQNRLARAGSVVANHQVVLGVFGAADPDVGIGKPAILSRSAIAFAMLVVSPVVNPDLLSIISL